MKKPTQEEYSEAIKVLEKTYGHIIVRMPFLHLMAIIGGLQLALRHPSFPATSGKLLTDWINEMAEQLPSPTLRRYIKCGFDPEYDEEIKP